MSTLYILDSANNKAKLTVTYNGKNVTKAAKYKSSNRKIAKVNKNGVVTAVRPGTVKITAKYKGKSRTTKVTIKKAKLSLNKKTIELSRGQKFTLKAFANKSGIRHRKGLPVRGQKTKTNARTRKGPKRTVANKKK